MEHVMPNLNSLALFAAVIDAKSFSRAAQRLKVPTSTVSRRIADLETELGARLLARSTRKLRPTTHLVLQESFVCRRRPAFPTRCFHRLSVASRLSSLRLASRSLSPNE